MRQAILGAALYAMGLALCSTSLIARPVDLSAPSGGLGAADPKGYLEIWREIPDVGITFGKDSFLPLRFQFSTNNATSGLLGSGFYLPMFEARNILIREQMMKALLPCGKALYLRRDPADLNKFATLDGAWTGFLKDDDFTITRDDGWTVLYHQGRLTSITTDQGRVFTWNYDGVTGMPTDVSEGGQSLITVEPNQQGLLGALVFGGKRYEFGYAERPLTEMLLGQPAVKGLALAVSRFQYPDGKKETFSFSLTPDRIPTLVFSNRYNLEETYTWDVATNHVNSEQGPQGIWTYKIGDIPYDFGLPPLSRTRSDGKVEGLTVDIKMGTYTVLSTDGSKTVTHVFETPGPLYNKVQKVEKVTDHATTLLYRASFDEQGRLMRMMDGNGLITNFTYDNLGQLIGRTQELNKEPQFMQELRERESKLLQAVASSKSIFDKDRTLDTLAMFYLAEMKEPAKALELAQKVTQRPVRYEIEVMAANHDDSLNYSQKIARYKVLANEFPERKGDLDVLVQQSQQMINATLTP